MRTTFFFFFSTDALPSLYVTPSQRTRNIVGILFLIVLVHLNMVLYSFLSLALIARQNNYVRPVLTADSMLDIKNGRLEPLIVQFMLNIQ